VSPNPLKIGGEGGGAGRGRKEGRKERKKKRIQKSSKMSSFLLQPTLPWKPVQYCCLPSFLIGLVEVVIASLEASRQSWMRKMLLHGCSLPFPNHSFPFQEFTSIWKVDKFLPSSTFHHKEQKFYPTQMSKIGKQLSKLWYTYIMAAYALTDKPYFDNTMNSCITWKILILTHS